MVFRSFYIRLALRIAVLTLLLFMLSYSIVNENYVRSVYMALFSVVSAVELFFFVRGFTARINYFIDSILQRDFTVHFNENSGETYFKRLFGSLNRITEVFRKISSEKEIKHRYLELLVDHVRTGLISFDEEGKVQLVNDAFLKLSGVHGLTQLVQLKEKKPALFEALQSTAPGEKKLVRMTGGSFSGTIVLFSSEFKLDDRLFKLVSAQNITQELSVAEIEAWQRLIKVLTHEIMNSISPIMSLSGTLDAMVKKRMANAGGDGEWETIHSGIEAIHIRSQGLYEFTQRYRELSRIPMPTFEQCDLSVIVTHTLDLLRSEITERGVEIRFRPTPLFCSADPALMQQVLLNILRNSLDAMGGCASPAIGIDGHSLNDRIELIITDNGSGIEDAYLDKVFIPFFTTKKNGSGIGLALSRQIVLLHGGEIFIRSGSFGTEVKIVV